MSIGKPSRFSRRFVRGLKRMFRPEAEQRPVESQTDRYLRDLVTLGDWPEQLADYYVTTGANPREVLHFLLQTKQRIQ